MGGEGHEEFDSREVRAEGSRCGAHWEAGLMLDEAGPRGWCQTGWRIGHSWDTGHYKHCSAWPGRPCLTRAGAGLALRPCRPVSQK